MSASSLHKIMEILRLEFFESHPGMEFKPRPKLNIFYDLSHFMGKQPIP